MFRSVKPRSNIALGCVFAMLSAMLTCLMLFVNGSFVLAVLKASTPTDSQWMRDPRVMQFILLAASVILVVLEWMLIDYLRTRFRRK